jgi:carbon monoxide dehydrogenase subunit G
MIRLEESITVDIPQQQAFYYVADFTTVAEWDPGVAASVRRDAGPPAKGATYDLQVRFGGSTSPMTYVTSEYRPHDRVVLNGRGSGLSVVDTVTFERAVGGTKITYRADLSFRGARRFLEPFLKPALRRLGRRAVDGLERALERRSATIS